MTRCPYCDGAFSPLGVRLGYRIGRCADCHSVACLDDVGEDVLAGLYGDPGYYSGTCPPYGYDCSLDRNDVQRTPVWERRLVEIGQTAQGRRLLELGPGRGGFMRMAQARGWEVTAVEPYPAGHLPGPRFADVEAASIRGPYDAVCLFDVLEHVKEPARLLQQVATVVAPDGCVAIGLPNVDGPSFLSEGIEWVEVKPPEHLSLPSAEGMRRLAARVGLSVTGVMGHLAETWLWEPLRGLLDPRSAQGALGAATRFGARVANRGAREIRIRLPAPPPERQDYVTWLLVPAPAGATGGG